MTGIFNMQGSKQGERKLLLIFMIGWFVINCLQAALVGIDRDEAYYWYLAQQIDWGYFDHPPMVTLFIRLGEILGHHPLFTRLGTILLSTFTIPAVYFALPDHLQKIKLYLLLFASVLLFNVYGFITTPDASLLFFTACFFVTYKYFLQKESMGVALLMPLAITGMFYSKYHGILPVMLVVLSNPKLLTRKQFWLVVLIVTLLFLPHLYWQYRHDWPTFRFHLIERLSKKYSINFTTDYLLGQLLIWGPITSLYFFFKIYKIKIRDAVTRAHLFSFVGVLAFFLFSSFKNNVEPHWTLIAGVSFVVLFMQLVVNGSEKQQKIFVRLCSFNIALIIVARILFLVPGSPFDKISNYRAFFHGKAWADTVYKAAGQQPVIFSNSYANPSIYRYYHPDVQTSGYSSKDYRKTNYSMSTADCGFNGKPVWFYNGVGDHRTPNEISIDTKYEKAVMVPIASYVCVSALKIEAEGLPATMKPGETTTAVITILNKTADTIDARKIRIDYAFFEAKYEFFNANVAFKMPDELIPPGYQRRLRLPLTAPQKTGKYRLLFSFINDIIPGNFASNFYYVTVE